LGLLAGLASEDSSLDSGTVRDSLIGVDGLVKLTTAEKLGHKGLDLGDTGRATNEDNIIDLEDRGQTHVEEQRPTTNLVARDLRILQDFLNRIDGGFKHGRVDLLESGAGDIGGKVLTLHKQPC
jgi:hypothetical protein